VTLSGRVDTGSTEVEESSMTRRWRIADKIPQPLCGPEDTVLTSLKSFVRQGVRYVVVGGYAVRYHGARRQPMDLDLFVESSSVNFNRVVAALRDMGARDTGERLDPERRPVKLQFRTPAGCIEVFAVMEGLDFEAVYGRSEPTIVGDTTIRVIGLDDLIVAKRLARDDPKRAKRAAVDRADLDVLLRIRDLRKAQE
jgi:hypothetical protein